MAEKKEKQYVSDNAQLMDEWDWDKNGNLGFDPQKMTCGSERKAWWKCKKSHNWQATIASRNQGKGCPYCANRKVLIGYNDLQTANPSLSKEWHLENNQGLTPMDITSNSDKKVWWRCNEGHEWQARIADRSKGNGCPYCAGKKVLVGYNDLNTVNIELAKEWNYEKNKSLTPMDVTANSDKKVWWKCSKGHEWVAKIYSRSNGSGCPACSSEKHTSFPEYAMIYYLQKQGLDVIHSSRKYGYELDVYIPSLKIAIEYDGYYWHKDKVSLDLEKNRKCENDGIKLYRIREGLSSLNDSSIDYVTQRNQKDFPKILEEILHEIIGVSVDIDFERDAIAIGSLREYTDKEKSVLFANPKLAKEWNYEMNGDLKPQNFTVSSQRKVWWRCQIGHNWQSTIANRSSGYGCPYCANQKVLKGYNDLQTANPTLAKEWSYKQNGKLLPDNFTANSHKKVWWICHNGHEWQATIKNRNYGYGCPYCAGQKVLPGYNDLQSINPSLAKEWHYEKNIGLEPIQVTSKSHRKVWWKCCKGHEFRMAINERNKGRECPQCNKEKLKSTKEALDR